MLTKTSLLAHSLWEQDDRYIVVSKRTEKEQERIAAAMERKRKHQENTQSGAAKRCRTEKKRGGQEYEDNDDEDDDEEGEGGERGWENADGTHADTDLRDKPFDLFQTLGVTGGCPLLSNFSTLATS